MKANELMMGDWVTSQDLLNRPARYAGIVTEHTPLNGQLYRRLRCWWPGDTEGADVPEERLLPIPLTDEILKKNGFKQVGPMYRNPEFNITIREVFGGDFFLSISVRDVQLKYVHELQHALRLCGIEKEIEL